MKRCLAILLVVVFAVSLGLTACGSGSERRGKQEEYTLDKGLTEMTVNWTAASGDRRSEKFGSVVFAGDVVDDWAEDLTAEIAAYQKSTPKVKYADMDEISLMAEHDLIILSDGLIQLKGGKSAAEYAGTLEALIYQLLDQIQEDAVILVTSLPYISPSSLGEIPQQRVAEYNASIRAVAMGANVLYANIYRAQSQMPWAMGGDGMSMSDTGNILAAGEVLQRLMRGCSCLTVDGRNDLTVSAIKTTVPGDDALQSFRDAQNGEQMRQALLDTRLGVDLDLFRSLDTPLQQQVCQALAESDRSAAANYMIADILVNTAVVEALGERKALDWPTVPFKTYVAVGDSITEGCMATDKRTDVWVAHLAEMISAAQGQKVTLLNRGIGGTKMSTVHQHYPAAKDTVQQYIAAADPDLITIAYGINDFHAGTTLNTFIGDYQNYLQEVVDSCPNAVIMVCGLLYKGNDQDSAKVRAWNDAIREMAESFGLIYCETYYDMYGVNWLLADGLHPNNAGYRVMGSTAFRTLCEKVNLSA